MSTRTKVTIETIKMIHDKTETGIDGKKIYTEDFRKMVINFHYSSGMHMRVISEKTGISQTNIVRWKRIHGTDQTAFIHGTKMRNDVRTRCLAVQEILDFNQDTAKVATKYGVTQQSINVWINKYRQDYKNLIDAPDGIPYIVKEGKMVFGRSNIEKIRAVLQAQHTELVALIDTMHMTGIQADLMRKCAEETLKKEDSLVQAAAMLEENGIELK